MKIVLACGGTGGHIFPAFSVAEELKKRYPDVKIIYVCGKKDIENEIFKIIVDEKVVSIESAPARMALSLSGFHFLLKLGKGFVQAFGLLRRERPDIVVGFGGHFSFPVVFAARFLGIKTMIHEQNARPGAANKFLIRFSDAVALSYEETKKFLPPHRNARVTGNPIRSSIETASKEDALKFFKFSDKKKTLLILGGSQGAESLNTLLVGALDFFSGSFKADVQLLHLCGKMMPSEAEKKFREAGIDGRAFSFFDRMDLAYAVADAALGRAGATFLAEVASRKRPVVLVPYPFGDGHQRDNAAIFAREHSAIVLEQNTLDPQKLAKVLTEAMDRAGVPDIKNTSERKENARIKLSDFIVESIGSSK